MKNARLDLLPSGYFMAVAKTIGATDEELCAIEENPDSITKDRKELLNLLMTQAMYRLHNTCPMGLG
ncbi:MAG: hypothetical protein ACLP3R_11125 [Candidatus Korobacteraceae bacterium]